MGVEKRENKEVTPSPGTPRVPLRKSWHRVKELEGVGGKKRRNMEGTAFAGT